MTNTLGPVNIICVVGGLSIHSRVRISISQAHSVLTRVRFRFTRAYQRVYFLVFFIFTLK